MHTASNCYLFSSNTCEKKVIYIVLSNLHDPNSKQPAVKYIIVTISPPSARSLKWWECDNKHLHQYPCKSVFDKTIYCIKMNQSQCHEREICRQQDNKRDVSLATRQTWRWYTVDLFVFHIGYYPTSTHAAPHKNTTLTHTHTHAHTHTHTHGHEHAHTHTHTHTHCQ